MGVNDTLEERGEVYGDYKGGLDFRGTIMYLTTERYKDVHGKPMPDVEAQYFLDVIGKLSRLAVSPTHKDSWHDLAGYALLIEGVLNDDSK